MRFARRFLRWAIRLLAVVLLLIAGGVIYLQTPAGRGRVRALIVSQSQRFLTGHLSIDQVHGSLFTGIRLDGVRLNGDDGEIVAIDGVTVHYSAWQLARNRDVVLTALMLEHPVVTLRHDARGWNVGRLLKPRSPGGGPPRTFLVSELNIRGGRLMFTSPVGPAWLRFPQQLSDLSGRMRLHYRAGDFSLGIDDLSAVGSAPTWSIVQLSGGLHIANGVWALQRFHWATTASHFTVDGRFTTTANGRMEVSVTGAPFDFPETARLIPSLKSIKVPAQLQANLRGPYEAVDTTVSLRSPAGNIDGRMLLNMSAPGWTGTGSVSLASFDVGRWLPAADTSSITGRLKFDLDLGLGRYLPRGHYEFSGPSVAYAGYAATQFSATGNMTAVRAEIDRATGIAYESPITVRGWIALAPPFAFKLRGSVRELDLRGLPRTVPVPKVASSLTFEHDTEGSFRNPFVRSQMRLTAPSMFVGATLNEGTTGTIDTSLAPIVYSASGELIGLSLPRLAEAFNIASLRDPRYRGVVSGAFGVEGTGSSLETLALSVHARSVGADLFAGRLLADTLEARINGPTLEAVGSGSVSRVDLAIPANAPSLRSSLTGSFRLDARLPGFFDAGTSLQDMRLSGSMRLKDSTIGEVQLTSAEIAGDLERGLVTLDRLDVATASGTARGSGTVALAGGSTDFAFEAHEPVLAPWFGRLGIAGSGAATIRGRATGDTNQVHVSGTATSATLSAKGVATSDMSASYQVQIPLSAPRTGTARVEARSAMIAVAGRELGRAELTVNGALTDANVTAHLGAGANRTLDLQARVQSKPEAIRIISVSDLHAKSSGSELRLADAPAAVEIRVNEVTVEGLTLVASAHSDARFTAAARWNSTTDAASARVTATRISIATLVPFIPELQPYSGTLDSQLTLGGTIHDPRIEGTFALNDGTFRNFKFASLHGSATRQPNATKVDVRLDQSPGTWLTLEGVLPDALFSSVPAVPMDLRIRSSPIDAALIGGLTTRLQDVHGILTADVRAVGPPTDPHLTGSIDLHDAAFLVPANGGRYRNGTLQVVFEPDTARFERFRLEDDDGGTIEFAGSVNTHDLRLGQVGAEISASRFAVLRNEYGNVDLNGVFSLTGNPTALAITGDVAVERGTIEVDRLLDWINTHRATPPGSTADVEGPDGVPAGPATEKLPLWDRLTLRLRAVATNNLRLRGTNLKLNAGSQFGVGDIDLLVGTDVTLRHRPFQPVELTGELATARGTYVFAGRRFTIDSESSVRFLGSDAANPTLSINAHRDISSVDVRVGLKGPLSEARLELSSSPQLEETDILSLILFNVPQSALATQQRDALAIQAAGLTTGVLASPAITALGRSVGLDLLTVEPVADVYGGTRVSAGRGFGERAFVTVSREFGHQTFNEFMLEYDLARFLRLRVTSTDAPTVIREGLYRRLDRVGIDLIFFFSY